MIKIVVYTSSSSILNQGEAVFNNPHYPLFIYVKHLIWDTNTNYRNYMLTFGYRYEKLIKYVAYLHLVHRSIKRKLYVSSSYYNSRL